jgi:hypothetical protein
MEMTPSLSFDGSLLRSTLSRVRDVKENDDVPVVVFDLDGTLFDNGPRTWNILAEFAEASGRGALRRALNGLRATGLPYLLTDTLRLAGVTDDQTLEEARTFWGHRFFTHTYQTLDVPLAGARRFVEEVFKAGAVVVYLTGRDVPGMAVGCVQSLHDHGFPVALARTALVLKHDFDTPDIDFKTEAVEFITRLGTVVASFDNEPGNVNMFLKRWPSSLSVLIETTHAPGAPALADGAARAPDFLA